MSKKKKKRKKKNFGHYMKIRKAKLKKGDKVKTIQPPTFVLKEGEKISDSSPNPNKKVEEVHNLTKSFLITDTFENRNHQSENSNYHNYINRFRLQKELNKDKKDQNTEDAFRL